MRSVRRRCARAAISSSNRSTRGDVAVARSRLRAANCRCRGLPRRCSCATRRSPSRRCARSTWRLSDEAIADGVARAHVAGPPAAVRARRRRNRGRRRPQPAGRARAGRVVESARRCQGGPMRCLPRWATRTSAGVVEALAPCDHCLAPGRPGRARSARHRRGVVRHPPGRHGGRRRASSTPTSPRRWPPRARGACRAIASWCSGRSIPRRPRCNARRRLKRAGAVPTACCLNSPMRCGALRFLAAEGLSRRGIIRAAFPPVACENRWNLP